MTPFLIFAGISAAFTVAGTINSIAAANAAANAQEQSIKTQELSTQYKIAKQKEREAGAASQYIEHNEAVAVYQGEALNSPSLNAVQVSTLQHSEQALQADTTYQEVNKLSAEAATENVKEQNEYQDIGSVIQGASSIANSFASASAMGKRQAAANPYQNNYYQGQP